MTSPTTNARHSKVTAGLALATLLGCSGQGGQPGSGAPEAGAPSGDLATQVGAFDAVPRTIPYSGYVDFDGQPVNAGSVKFNFAIFRCATPGTGANGCDALWVAKGGWTNAADWTQGWPAGASDVVTLPVFAGRFTAELGAVGQNALPAEVFEGSADALYLATRIEGKPLGGLQKLVPTPRTQVAELAHRAEVADLVGDLSPEDIATRRSWATSGDVAPGGTLELQTFGDATGAEVLLWERRGSTWVSIDATKRLRDDPALYAYYPFEDATAPGRDESRPSGQGKDLTLLESATRDAQVGAVGASLDFNGGFATTTNLGLVLGGGVTLSAWMRPRAFHPTHLWTLSPSGSNYFILTQFDDSVCGLPGRIRVYGDYISPSYAMCGMGQPRSEKWTHVVIVYDNETKTQLVYLDGVLDNRAGGNIAFPAATINYMRLGGWFGGHGNDYWGHLDEVAIFNRVLSPGEVDALYRYGVNAGYSVERSTNGRVTVKNNTTSAQTLRVLVVKE